MQTRVTCVSSLFPPFVLLQATFWALFLLPRRARYLQNNRDKLLVVYLCLIPNWGSYISPVGKQP
ncbi:hypothetical protein C8R45DRAFT_979294 [Mycena sanguinolenta]|nr:hypothetical protein C8R45DRAFT_979294 [Mycena sanguinolenta]